MKNKGILFFAFLSVCGSLHAQVVPMENYCMQPPFVSNATIPNVLIILDTSGSMLFQSYNRTTDPNLSVGFNSTTSYYGYFDPEQWYVYSGNTFTPAGPKTPEKPPDTWDGNFLNWLTMRRVDIVRKVLVGGKVEGTRSGPGVTHNLLAEPVDGDQEAGHRKQVGPTVTPFSVSPFTGDSRCFYFPASSTAPAVFHVLTEAASCQSTDPLDFEASFEVRVQVPDEPEGLYQEIGDRVRWGLMRYNTSNSGTGGLLLSPIQNGTSLSFIQQVEGNRPNGNTPLAEAVWSGVGYFAQTAETSTVGPRYFTTTYSVGTNVDPLNFNQGGEEPLFLPCAKNFIITVTDGEPNGDKDLPDFIEGFYPDLTDGDTEVPNWRGVCSANRFWDNCSLDGTHYIDDVTMFSRVNVDDPANPVARDLRADIDGNQFVNHYVIFAAFDQASATPDGRRLMQQAAAFGGFIDGNGNSFPDDIDLTAIPIEWGEADGDQDGLPDTYFEPSEGFELEDSIREALLDVLKRSASSTSVSVLASGEGQGANIMQAFFFPRKDMGAGDAKTELTWIGYLQNLWFFIDPFLQNSSIREETFGLEAPGGVNSFILDLQQDFIVEFFFTDDQTRANLLEDEDGDGVPDTDRGDADIDGVKAIWSAGLKLFDFDPADREILTSINGTDLIPFTTGNRESLFDPDNSINLLQATSDSDADEIIQFVRGVDFTGKRNRTATLEIDGTDVTNTWKLGDIVDSSARIVGVGPLNLYHEIYLDGTYKQFVSSTNYLNRGLVLVGANDGMLHAFRLGKLEFSWPEKTGKDRARLTGDDLGREEWAFIPKNALPYLRYLSDPDYCHLYYVDATPVVFDASIGTPAGCSGNNAGCDLKTTLNPDGSLKLDETSWRTVVVGSMRLGGACGCNGSDCVNPPNNQAGLSSYFAIDITNPANPDLLWEFTHPDLGFSTSGPGIVKILFRDNDEPQKDRNGHWFVVIGSGPTGPIDQQAHQFLGQSSQNLQFFVLDLRTGALVRTIDTGIENAFAGNVSGSTIDIDKDYQDDVLYSGFTKRTGTDPDFTWTAGGVLRILTEEDPNPANWQVSPIIDNIGPVTAGVAHLQDRLLHDLFIFFGEGRYFFKDALGNFDDPDTVRNLFGIKEPCYQPDDTLEENCDDVVTVDTLTPVDDEAIEPEAVADSAGWILPLSPSDGQFKAERLLTNPVAVFSGAVVFSTSAPSGDQCSSGGNTFLWAIKYNTGSSGAGLLYGLGLAQTSTGAIEQTDLSGAFTEEAVTNEPIINPQTNEAIGRKSTAIIGISSSIQPPTLIVPRPYKRIISVFER